MGFPLAGNFQLITAIGLEDGAEVEVEVHAGFLSAGMEPQREAAAVGGPQFRFAEGLCDGLVGGAVDEREVLCDVAALHGLAEMDVKFQVVGGQAIGAREDGRDLRRGGVDGDGVFEGGLLAGGVGENCLVCFAGEQGELWSEANRAAGDFHLPEQGLSALGAHGQLARGRCHHHAAIFKTQPGLCRTGAADSQRDEHKNCRPRAVHRASQGPRCLVGKLIPRLSTVTFPGRIRPIAGHNAANTDFFPVFSRYRRGVWDK